MDKTTPPKTLSSNARKAWLKVCADLEKEGNLDAVDCHLIEIYSKTYDVFQRATEQLEQEPLVPESSANGRPFINPLVTALNTLNSRLVTMLGEMGLTPSRRKDKRSEDGKAEWSGLDV